jgi:hypothetical protein
LKAIAAVRTIVRQEINQRCFLPIENKRSDIWQSFLLYIH